MRLGPVFTAEFVTTGRRSRYIWLRVIYASALFFALWSVHASYSNYGALTRQQVTNLTADFFNVFAGLQVAAVLLLAPAYTAGAIAVERERRTIEYLFATDLKNREIVLGKLAARLWGLLCQALAGLPILALAMLLGGIEPGRLLLVFVVSLTTIASLAAVGLCVSVWSPRAREATMRAYLIVVAWLLLPILSLALPWGVYGWVAPVTETLLEANPAAFLFRLWEFGGPFAAIDAIDIGPLMFAFLWQHALVVAVCVPLAVWAVRRVHLRDVGKADRERSAWRLWRPALGQRPMLWKEIVGARAAARLGVVGRLAALAIFGVSLTLILWQYVECLNLPATGWWGASEQFMAYIVCMLGSVLGVLGLILLAARAAGCVTSEKEKDTWDSVLASRLEPGEIVHAKMLGNLYSVRWIAALLLFMWLLEASLDPGYVAAIPFVAATHLVLACFVNALGVFFSLRMKSSMRAMAATLGLGVFVGGGYLFTCCLPIFFASGPGDEVAFAFAPCMPFLMVLPSIAYQDGEEFWRHGAELLAAYVIGVVGYAFAAFALWAGSVTSFDALSGRTSRPFGPSGAPPTGPPRHPPRIPTPGDATNPFRTPPSEL